MRSQERDARFLSSSRLFSKCRGGHLGDAAEDLLARYFDRAPGVDLIRSHAAMQCASLLREAMWSMVSELYLDAPGADYVAYTQENLDALDVVLGSYRTRFGKA